jgi:CubicO group peptidase (beta-lactamase class C family)
MKKALKKRVYGGFLITCTVAVITAAIYYFRRKTKTTAIVDAPATGSTHTTVVKQPFSSEIVYAFDTFLNANAEAYGEKMMIYVGKADKEYTYQKINNDFDDYIGIASGSKYLAAATIMTLVDEGRLDLDTPLSVYLPWIAAYTGYKDFTVRQILAHRTGMVADTLFDNTQNMGLEAAAKAIVNAHPFLTGASYPARYSSSSYKFAARVAEVVSNQKWEELFQKRIAQKCDMKNTFFSRFGDNPDVGKGAASSLNDYAHFMEMLCNDGTYNGTRVVSAKSVREMETLQAGSTEYGLGCWVFPEVSEVAAQGALGLRAWINRKTNCYGVIFTIHADSYAISQQFKELVRTKLA